MIRDFLLKLIRGTAKVGTASDDYSAAQAADATVKTDESTIAADQARLTADQAQLATDQGASTKAHAQVVSDLQAVGGIAVVIDPTDPANVTLLTVNPGGSDYTVAKAPVLSSVPSVTPPAPAPTPAPSNPTTPSSTS